ncbi:MAG: hypothetical protein ACREMW_03795 [Gemmatimonadales bacterium]
MKTTHTGLGITQADWDKSVQLLVATLNKFKAAKGAAGGAGRGVYPQGRHRRTAVSR